MYRCFHGSNLAPMSTAIASAVPSALPAACKCSPTTQSRLHNLESHQKHCGGHFAPWNPDGATWHSGGSLMVRHMHCAKTSGSRILTPMMMQLQKPRTRTLQMTSTKRYNQSVMQYPPSLQGLDAVSMVMFSIVKRRYVKNKSEIEVIPGIEPSKINRCVFPLQGQHPSTQ